MSSQAMLEPTAQRVARLALIHAGEVTLKLRFVKDTIAGIDETTSRADLLANECDSTDYAAGGYAITYTTGGLTASRVAYNYSAALGFVVVTAAPPNTIIGAWIDDGANALQRVEFAQPVALDTVGKQMIGQVYDGYPPGVVGIDVDLP